VTRRKDSRRKLGARNCLSRWVPLRTFSAADYLSLFIDLIQCGLANHALHTDKVIRSKEAFDEVYQR
jgi:hypothetical protein